MARTWLLVATLGLTSLVADRVPAATGAVPAASFVAYLAEPYSGEGWTPLHPITLEDLPGAALIDLPHPGDETPYEVRISQDGSTIVVSDIRPSADPPVTVVDGRTGTVRSHLRPPAGTLPFRVSDDGARVLTRRWDVTPTSPTDIFVVDLATGHTVSTLHVSGGYYIPTPHGERLYRAAAYPTGSDKQEPLAVTIADATTAEVVARWQLPEVLIGPTDRSVSVGGQSRLSPAIAWSPDGKRLAVHAADRDLLLVVDMATLTIARRPLYRSVSPWDILRPLIAEAKELNDWVQWQAKFADDGRHLYVLGQRVERRSGGSRSAITLRLVDTDDGRIVAEMTPSAFTSEWVLAPDGSGLYLTVFEPSLWGTSPRWELQRLDPRTLEVTARRWIPGFRQPMFVAPP